MATALRRDLTVLSEKPNSDGSSVAVRAAVLQMLKDRIAAGRKIAERMLMEDGSGTACAERLSHLMDEIIRALYDFTVTHVYRAKNPSTAERMAIVAVAAMDAARWRLAPTSTCSSSCPTSRRPGASRSSNTCSTCCGTSA